MDGSSPIVALVEAGTAGRNVVGGKAGVLGELMAAGYPVPPGFVVAAAALRKADDLDAVLADAVRRLGAERLAVRSSAAAEDLPDASFAGLYETFLNVDRAGLAPAVRRCFASAGSPRVAGYRGDRAPRGAAGGGSSAMAVLVQRMVDATAAGVAFTAHPVTGNRDQVVITAVSGLGERLVSGETTGAQWTVEADRATLTGPASEGGGVLSADQAVRVAELARGVADRYARPQDIEWAIGPDGRLWLVQARPMTALPDPVSFTPPGPGVWMRNFRIGEWLPEAVTPLFATWLLPRLEEAYLDGMAGSIGVRVPFRCTLLHGWYYTATPIPSPRLLARVIRRGRARAVRVLFYTLIRVGRDPAAADRHALAGLYRQWQERLPRYRRLVESAGQEIAAAPDGRLVDLVDEIAHEAGVYLWYLAIVGGSAWKMEAALLRFCRAHLSAPLARVDAGMQVLLRGLPGAAPGPVPPHAVQSLDWYHPVAGELPVPAADPEPRADGGRYQRLAEQRAAAEASCRDALATQPRVLARFTAMLAVAQRYAEIRERQARDLTLGWPVLRDAVRRLGQRMAAGGLLDRADDVFFCTRSEVEAFATGDGGRSVAAGSARRRREWERQRRLVAPLTLGRPPRLIGDVIDTAVHAARGGAPIPEGAIVGHPASAGRATGPVRQVRGPDDFAAFRTGEVLVARATAPAWTPLFAHAAAVVTDGGTLAAHASLVAREYGIPAVVGTTDATTRLHTGQIVTVDGTTGTVIPAGGDASARQG